MIRHPTARPVPCQQSGFLSSAGSRVWGGGVLHGGAFTRAGPCLVVPWPCFHHHALEHQKRWSGCGPSFRCWCGPSSATCNRRNAAAGPPASRLPTPRLRNRQRRGVRPPTPWCQAMHTWQGTARRISGVTHVASSLILTQARAYDGLACVIKPASPRLVLLCVARAAAGGLNQPCYRSAGAGADILCIWWRCTGHCRPACKVSHLTRVRVGENAVDLAGCSSSSGPSRQQTRRMRVRDGVSSYLIGETPLVWEQLTALFSLWSILRRSLGWGPRCARLGTETGTIQGSYLRV